MSFCLVEFVARDETIEILQTKIQTMQSEHSRELTTMQARHAAETANLTKRQQKEVSLLKAIISKATTWFPYFREMLRMESVCRTVGFDDVRPRRLSRANRLRSGQGEVREITKCLLPTCTETTKMQRAEILKPCFRKSQME